MGVALQQPDSDYLDEGEDHDHDKWPLQPVRQYTATVATELCRVRIDHEVALIGFLSLRASAPLPINRSSSLSRVAPKIVRSETDLTLHRNCDGVSELVTRRRSATAQ